MSTIPLDYFSDTNRVQLHTVESVFGTPDFVKQAAPTSVDLPNTVYADTVNKLYPCHTKVATWLSQTYFLMNRHLYSTEKAAQVQGRIVKAAEYFGMEGLINGLETRWQQFNHPAVKDADYALVVEHEGQKIKRMPLTGPEAIKASAAFFAQNRSKYPYEWRKSAARKILARAVAEDAQLDGSTLEILNKSAGYGFNAPQNIGQALRERAALLSDRKSEAHDQTVKLAEALATAPISNVSVMQKIAAVIDVVDRELGLTKYYDKGLSLPEDVCFEYGEKEAADAANGWVKLTTGNAWSLDDLSEMPLDKIAGVLGDDFVKAVATDDGMSVSLEKFAEIAPTLPRDDAALLEQVLRAARGHPGRGSRGACGGTRRRDGSGGGVGNRGTADQPKDAK